MSTLTVISSGLVGAEVGGGSGTSGFARETRASRSTCTPSKHLIM